MAGRFLLNLQTGQIHDLRKKTPQCNLDEIDEPEFVDHLWPAFKQELKQRKNLSKKLKRLSDSSWDSIKWEAFFDELYEISLDGIDGCGWCFPELSRDPGRL